MFLERRREMKSIKWGLMIESHGIGVSENLGRCPFRGIFLFLCLFSFPFWATEVFPQEKTEEGAKTLSSGQKSEKFSPDNPRGVGVLEVPRADGRKDKIYFSTMTPEEESRSAAEEKEKSDRSWDMLRNIIIDRRAR
jgi:hypothetical protein